MQTHAQWDVWDDVKEITDWLDDFNGCPPDEVHLRVMKIGEEFGEVVSAYIGTIGQNPRKGVYATDTDVMAELSDVVVAAMVAMNTIAGDAVVARAQLAARMGALLKRARAGRTPPCPACGGGETFWMRADAWECTCGHEFTVAPDGSVSAEVSS